ncbi:hypothetical protein, partial [Corynebacterium matruchotii]|uniref:hypothetical protein n=1 Tax=Corynebacterium matruchotii TaxID=43768 RepID=UPI003C7009EE
GPITPSRRPLLVLLLGIDRKRLLAEELDVPLSWDKKTQTLTLTGTDYSKKPFTINAKKQDK